MYRQLLKRGQNNVLQNYRPVSLTSHVCKVLESISRDTIIDHLHKCELLNNMQHGFVKNR